MEFLGQDVTNPAKNCGRNVKLVDPRIDNKSRRTQGSTETRYKQQPKLPIGVIGQCFDFIEMIGIFLGWKMNQNWKSNPRHLCTVGYLVFTWTQVLYSQFKHFLNGEHKRIIEAFAMYGACISVKFNSRLTERKFKKTFF